MKKLSKIIALFLAVLMSVSTLAVTAFAEPEDGNAEDSTVESPDNTENQPEDGETEATSYTVNVTVGEGGVVVAGTSGISGGSSGSITVNAGESLSLILVPNVGYEVDSLTVDGVAQSVSGTNYTLANVSADTAVNITFKTTASAVNEYTVSVSVGNGGNAVVGSTTVAGGASGQITAKEGDTLSLAVTADSGFEVDSVTVNGSAVALTDGSYSFSVTADTTVVIAFKETAPAVQYNATLTVNGNGSISVAGTTATNGKPASLSVKADDSITVVVTPEAGYELISLTVNGVAVTVENGAYTINGFTADTAIAAEFGVETFDVTFVLTGKGSIKIMEKDSGNVIDNVSSEGNESVTKTFQLTGYIKFQVITDGEYEINCGEPCNGNAGNLWFFSPITCDSTTYIVFGEGGNNDNPEDPVNPDEANVNVTVGNGGNILIGEQTVNGGTVSDIKVNTTEALLITVVPNEGNEVKTFKVNGVDVELTENTYAIEAVAGDVTLFVEFKVEGSEDAPDNLITAEDIDWGSSSIEVDATGKEISKDVFDKISSEVREGKYVTFVIGGGKINVPFGMAADIKGEKVSFTIAIVASGADYSRLVALYNGTEFAAYTLIISDGSKLPAGTKIALDAANDLNVYGYNGESLEDLNKDANGFANYNNEAILVCAKTAGAEDDVVVEESKEPTVSVNDNANSDASEDSDEGGNGTLIVVLVIVLVAVLGAAALFVVKWRQEKF